MNIKVKRVYDGYKKSDGFRVLVDRFWPRGVSKELARLNLWAKEVSPSSKLRSWFHADKEGRFKEFSKHYKQELIDDAKIKTFKKMVPPKGIITLVTTVKDIEHSHIPVLLKMLLK